MDCLQNEKTATAIQRRLIEHKDALANATDITYDFAGRFDEATYEDGNDVSIVGHQGRGLIDLASGDGTTIDPADLFFPDGATMTPAASAVLTDPLGNDSLFKLDRFGFVTAYEDALDNRTDIDRNANGQPTRITEPDPAGSAPDRARTQGDLRKRG
jgi:hypothetical protein